MEQTLIFFYTSFFALLLLLLIKTKILNKKKRRLNLPPSPPSLPILGHLHLIQEPVHRFLQSLTKKYGHVIYLKFGTRPVIVISSPSAVKECFTKNDIILANRPHFSMGKHLAYDNNTMVTSLYGDHWRNLRKITSLELLSTSSLNMSAGIRRDEIAKMVKKLCDYSSSKGGGYVRVKLRSLFKKLTLNATLRMISGEKCCGENWVIESENFTDIIQEVFEFADTGYLGDYVSFLRWIDYGGHVKRCKRLAKKLDAFFQAMIDEHRKDINNDKDHQDGETTIDRLLFLQKSEPEYYTDETIKGIIMVLIIGGTDTTAVTLEWGMSWLLNHPNILDKAKSEIDNQVKSRQDHHLYESDLPQLPYLQSILSETLRLCPPAPLLIPHMSSHDCQIDGFDIPRGTMLLVNAWAIQRDPNLWDEPSEFKPERFEKGKTEPDYYFNYLPFGLGRRKCPGISLANGMVGLALGSLIQCLEWKRVSDEKLDLSEGRGFTMPKAQPLEVMCKARPTMPKLL